MADQAGRSIEKTDPPPIRLSAGVVERARRMVDAPAKTPALQLSLFAVGAGLMAGMLIKRGRIPSRRA
ncbi:MAG TPA: hypothetical protein VG735_01485 [Caulobacterales bacterium]|jgi:hypothetical protein|nr:hypothetical protein [Caulobacterales bacterium]